MLADEPELDVYRACHSWKGLNTVRPPLVVCLVLFIAGCGGSDPRGVEGTDPGVWTRNVCTALRTWGNLEDPSADLRRRMQESKSPVESRSAIVAYYGALVARTDDLLRDLDEAGSPAVEDGAKVAQALRSGMAILRTAFANARERARGLPVDPNDQKSFVAMNRRIAESIDPAGERMERYFDRLEENLKTPELDRLWRRASECRSVH